MKQNQYIKEMIKLERLKKKELVGYIGLMNLVSETRPYIILHPSEKTKTKYDFIVDKSSTWFQVYKLLFKFIVKIIKNETKRD